MHWKPCALVAYRTPMNLLRCRCASMSGSSTDYFACHRYCVRCIFLGIRHLYGNSCRLAFVPSRFGAVRFQYNDVSIWIKTVNASPLSTTMAHRISNVYFGLCTFVRKPSSRLSIRQSSDNDVAIVIELMNDSHLTIGVEDLLADVDFCVYKILVIWNLQCNYLLLRFFFRDYFAWLLLLRLFFSDSFAWLLLLRYWLWC
mmetsp:Transcript_95360/g.150829  ORF Transcript_95360/g.150829 Transcript_95360/m.150829 type:complete len:200 (+) Transcript_95360:202-801(+)